MSFIPTPALPFVGNTSTLSSATANTWRANLSASLDTVGGGTYANVSTIDWSAGSAGWRFYAPLAVKSTGSLTLDGGATVTISADPALYGTLRVAADGASGGAVRFYATSTLTVDDTVAVSIAGDVTMTGASTEVHASGSTDTYSAGSALAIRTANAIVGSDAVLTVNGSAGHVAQVVRGQYSTDTYQSGAGLTCNSGSIFVVGSGCTVAATIGGGGNAGSLTFGANATTTHANGSAELHASGSADTYQSGSTMTHASGATFAQGGTTTRTGVEVLSGASAATGRRCDIGPNATTTIAATSYDYLVVPDITADRTWTLSAPAGALANVKHRIVVKRQQTAAANAFVVRINNPAGATIGRFNAVASSADAQAMIAFQWDPYFDPSGSSPGWTPETWCGNVGTNPGQPY